MNKQSKFSSVLLGFAGFVAVIALFGVAVMFLWNYLLPPIFGLPEIGYLQAVGLLILSRILFGGLGFHGGRNGGESITSDRNIRHGNPLREKWMNMSEALRKELMEKHKEYHKFFHGHGSYFSDFFCHDESGEKKDSDGEK
jgi:hypothetical protein